jgi:hypothetical protein
VIHAVVFSRHYSNFVHAKHLLLLLLLLSATPRTGISVCSSSLERRAPGFFRQTWPKRARSRRSSSTLEDGVWWKREGYGARGLGYQFYLHRWMPRLATLTFLKDEAARLMATIVISSPLLLLDHHDQRHHHFSRAHHAIMHSKPRHQQSQRLRASLVTHGSSALTNTRLCFGFHGGGGGSSSQCCCCCCCCCCDFSSFFFFSF